MLFCQFEHKCDDTKNRVKKQFILRIQHSKKTISKANIGSILHFNVLKFLLSKKCKEW